MDALTQFLLNLPQGAQLVLAILLGLYVLRFLDAFFFKNNMVTNYGIHPRTVKHILGIVLAHWLHINRKHLIGNTLPFLILGSMIAIDSIAAFWVVTAVSLLVAGVGTWIFGAKGNHAGASSLMTGYFGFIMLNGLRTNNLEPMIWALGVTAVNFGIFRTSFGYYEGLSRAFFFFGLIGGLLSVFVWEQVAAGA